MNELVSYLYTLGFYYNVAYFCPFNFFDVLQMLQAKEISKIIQVQWSLNNLFCAIAATTAN